MIKVNAFNPSATSVAFGSKSGENKSLTTLKMTPVGESFEYIKPNQLVHEKRSIGSLFRKGAMGLSVVLASFGLPGCGPNNSIIPEVEPPTKPPTTVVTLEDEVFQMLRNTYTATDEEVKALKLTNDTLLVRNTTGDYEGLKYLGRQGDSIVLRKTLKSFNTGKIGGVEVMKFFKAPGAAAGELSAREYSSPLNIYNDTKMRFEDVAKYFTKDNITKITYNGIDAIKSTPKTVGKIVDQYNLTRVGEAAGQVIRQGL